MEIAQALVRFLHYTALLILFGSVAYACAIAPLHLGGALSRRLGKLWILCAATALATWLPGLMLVAATLGDGLRDAINSHVLAAVAFDTTFGTAWLWHLLAMIVAGGSLAVEAIRDARRPSRISLVLLGATLASLAPIGHAVMPEGREELVSILSQALHLIAAAYWIGALVPVLMTLAMLRHGPRQDAITALKRFSDVGQIAVALVIASGCLNLFIVSGHRPLDLAAPYAVLVWSKITLVGLMVALAVLNRYRLVPAASRAPRIIDALRAATAAILALGLAATGLVSVFGLLSPT